MSEKKTKARVFDEYLVAAARLSDRKALAILAERWNGRFLAHAWRLLGEKEGARDAVQEAWVEIVQGLARLADERAFPAWAYRIVSRRCARMIRDLQNRRRLQHTMLAEPPPQQEESDNASDHDKLRAAIRLLPPDQRAAVALYHFEEMSIAEVAVALDIPAGTAKTRLMHARRKLRAALEGEPK